jgi:hypothetical protein
MAVHDGWLVDLENHASKQSGQESWHVSWSLQLLCMLLIVVYTIHNGQMRPYSHELKHAASIQSRGCNTALYYKAKRNQSSVHS